MVILDNYTYNRAAEPPCNFGEDDYGGITGQRVYDRKE